MKKHSIRKEKKPLRMKKAFKIVLGLVLIAATVFAIVQINANTLKKYERSWFSYFDTITTVTIYATNQGAAEAELQIIGAQLGKLHSLFDIYGPHEGVNGLYALNEAAGSGTPLTLDKTLMELLCFGVNVYEQTEGAVNIAFGSVLRLWSEARETALNEPENAAIPSPEALKAANEHTRISNLVINENDSTAYITDARCSLDVGAIAKGFAAQHIIDSARSRGVRALLISIGGNVSVLGSKPGEAPFTVGVTDPQNESQLLGIAKLSGSKSLVSSGDYQRFFMVDGVKYHHIIDTKTLMPGANAIGTTVCVADSGVADALSTALFLQNTEQERRALAERFNAEYIYVAANGQTEVYGLALDGEN